jgi:gp16 family phage-associated protein
MMIYVNRASSRMPDLKQVRDEFRRNGQTITEWAQAHGFDRQIVYALLGGRLKGDYGTAHRAAVALGIKPAGSAKAQENDPQV